MSTASQFFGSGGGGSIVARNIHDPAKVKGKVLEYDQPFTAVNAFPGAVQSYGYASNNNSLFNQAAATYVGGLYVVPLNNANYATTPDYTSSIPISRSHASFFTSGAGNTLRQTFANLGSTVYSCATDPNVWGNQYTVSSSTDGITWSNHYIISTQVLSFRSLNGYLVASLNGSYLYSTNGTSWTSVTSSGNVLSDSCYDSTTGFYYFVEQTGKILRTASISTAPTTVTTQFVGSATASTKNTIFKVGSRLIAFLGSGAIGYSKGFFVYSDNGVTWNYGADVLGACFDKNSAYAPRYSLTNSLDPASLFANSNVTVNNGIAYFLMNEVVSNTYFDYIGQTTLTLKKKLITTTNGVDLYVYDVGAPYSVNITNTSGQPPGGIYNLNNELFIFGANFQPYKIDTTAKEIVIEY